MDLKELRVAAFRFLCVVTALALFGQSYLPAKSSFKPFKLKTVHGEQKTLGDVLGKATLVTFFFPTCGYCNAEMPKLQGFYDKYREQGMSMVAINIMQDQNSLIADWQSSHRYTFAVLTGASLESLQDRYDIRATPTNFLLDATGKVLLKQTGYSPGDEKFLEEKIIQALTSAP